MSDDFLKDFDKDASVFIRKSIIWYLVGVVAILVVIAALAVGVFWTIHKIVKDDSHGSRDPVHHQTDRSEDRSDQEPLQP